MGLRRVLGVFLLLLLPAGAEALGPKDVFLVVNKNVSASRELADYYCKKRGVSKEHIVVLDLPKGEDIQRADFDSRLRVPLRKALQKCRDEVKVLLTVYGVPLRVGRAARSAREKERYAQARKALQAAQKKREEVEERLAKLTKSKEKEEKELQKELKTLRSRIRFLQRAQRILSGSQSVASVDSELSLLWWDDYKLNGWQVNLLHFRAPKQLRDGKPPIVMVARLDGPSVEICKRLVDDAMAVEQGGLKGKVYVDARGIGLNLKKDRSGSGYGGYDESLREMARLLKDKARMKVILDDKGRLFEPQSCSDTALYCGWYSHARYVPCCKFVRGAVAYHIASSEARSLRNAKAKYWCPNLLKDGVAATVGPVAEPYTIGFPKPAEFFGLLVTGEYTLVECYSKTLLLNSWMTVLVGDPLYKPYAKEPRLKVEQVEPSPKGSRFFLKSPD